VKEIISLARNAARAKNEHLSQVLCLAEAASQKIAVLDDLDGRSAAEHYAATRAPAVEAARIISQAAEVCPCLHGQGRSTVRSARRICDRVVRERPPVQFPLSGETMPSAGQGSATGPYCARSYCSRTAARQQCDLYSLGCVFYELLIGQPRPASSAGAPAGIAAIVESLGKQAAVPMPVAELWRALIDS